MLEIIQEPTPGVQITPAGAIIEGEVPLEQLEELISRTAQADRSCKHVMGDLINYATEHHGDNTARWMELTGWDYKTITRTAATCAQVSIERRHEQLDLEFHSDVRSLPPAEQSNWLRLVEEGKKSREWLRKSIKLGRPATSEDMTASPKRDGGYNTVHPHVNGVVVLCGKMEREGELDNLDGEELVEFAEDLLPVAVILSSLISRLDGPDDEKAKKELASELKALGFNHDSLTPTA